MRKEVANEIAKFIFSDWIKRHEEIMVNAKREGNWLTGLDANRRLFKELDEEVKSKLIVLNNMVDEDC